jgi:hypothetical protein
MHIRGTVNIDNRDMGQMTNYLEARVEALKRKITELELENAQLRKWSDVSDSNSASFGRSSGR